MNIIDRFRLDGKRALVTGAGRGLGKSFAHALAEAGADVAVSDIDFETVKITAEEIKLMGKESLAIKADISKHDDVYRMVDEVMSAWRRLDIAVNNVGVALPIKGALEVTKEEWDRVNDVNLRGTFFCMQAEAKAMMPNKYGKIINIASMCGYIVWPDQAVYNTTKAGIIHLTRSLAVEFIKHGIRVNSISPGVTRTPELFKEVIPIFLRKAPINRIAEVQDIQGAVIYLASELSDFMVGNDIVLDGGYTLI